MFCELGALQKFRRSIDYFTSVYQDSTALSQESEVFDSSVKTKEKKGEYFEETMFFWHNYAVLGHQFKKRVAFHFKIATFCQYPKISYHPQASADLLPNKILFDPNKAFAFDQK